MASKEPRNESAKVKQQLRCSCPNTGSKGSFVVPDKVKQPGSPKPVFKKPMTPRTGTPRPLPKPKVPPRRPQGHGQGQGAGVMGPAMDYIRSTVEEMYKMMVPLIPAPNVSAGPQPAPNWNNISAAVSSGTQAIGDVMNQIYSCVRDNLANPQVLGAFVQLLTSGNLDSNVAGQVSAAFLNNIDLGPALRTMDPASIANAVKAALEDPNVLGPLADYFGQQPSIISGLVGDKLMLLLLLHIITKVPQMRAMVSTLCNVAGDLVKDDMGRVILDAAVTRACPNHRLALLKALEIAEVDPEAAAPVKEVLLQGMALADPQERCDMLLNLFPELFITQKKPGTKQPPTPKPRAQKPAAETEKKDQVPSEETKKQDKQETGVEQKSGEGQDQPQAVQVVPKDKDTQELLAEIIDAEGGSLALESAVDKLIEKVSDAHKPEKSET